MNASNPRISGILVACGLSLAIQHALAQEGGQSTEARQPVTTLQEVTVVGSRLELGGPPEDGALPVTVLDATAIANSGSLTVQDLLLEQPQISGARGARDGDGSGRATLNLRGLGDQYTLTLVNGRRYSANAPANVNAIPFNAIERIEILEAGAGAVYGSDAVAGVVNVVLKDQADGLSLDAMYGDVGDGGAPVTQLGFSFGGSGEQGRYFFSGSHYKRDPLLASERALTRSNDMRAIGGRDNRSSANNPAMIAAVPGYGGPLVLNTDLVGRGQAPTSPADFRAYDFERDAHDRVPAGVTEIAGTERSNFYFSAERTLGAGNTRLFAEGLYTTERTLAAAGSTVVNLGNAAVGGVPASNPWNVFGVDITGTFSFRPLDIDGPLVGPNGTTGARGIRDLDTMRVLAGLRSSWSGYEFELFGGVFSEEAESRSPNSISNSGMRAALARTGPTAFNPFCNLCNTPEQYEGVRVNQMSRTKFRSPSVGASITGPAFELPAGQSRFAAGAEYRKDRTSRLADPLSTIGDIADSSPAPPYSLDRSVKAAYAELGVPLIEGDSPTLPALELGLAARYEHYSDFGSNFAPRVSVRWQASPSWILRGSFGESFRAPYLQQIAPMQSNAEVVVFDPAAGGAQVEAQAIYGGNPDLAAEEARSWSAGVIFQPLAVPELRLSLDYFNVRQTDLIIGPDPQAVISGIVPGLVRRGDGIGFGGEDVIIYALFSNIAERRMETLDFNASHAWPLANGARLALALSSSRLIRMQADTTDGRGLVDYAGEYTPLGAASGFGGLPKWRANLSATYQQGGLAAGASAYYVGSYLDGRASAPDPRNPARLDDYLKLDLFASYEFTGVFGNALDGLALRAGVENLFDEMPSFLYAGNSYDRGLFDIRGRFYYVGVSFRF